jgi:hypothetical protein
MMPGAVASLAPVSDTINFRDGHPGQLPARYAI